MKIISLFLHIGFLLTACSSPEAKNAEKLNSVQAKYLIPLGGNTFQITKDGQEEVTDKGIENWQQKETEYVIYFFVCAAV